MASRTKIGLRAITMQQPFASAMVHGLTSYTRRGKPAKFEAGGEWVGPCLRFFVRHGSAHECYPNEKGGGPLRLQLRAH